MIPLPNILDANTLLTIAVSVVLCYSVAWVLYVMLEYPVSEWSWRWFDGDSFPAGSLFNALRRTTRHKLKQRSDRRKMPTLGHRFDSHTRIALGDLCDVFRAESSHQTYVAKCPIVDTANTLMDREHEVLCDVHRRINRNRHRTWVPEPVDSFRASGRTVNVTRWRNGFRTAEEIHRRYPDGVHARHIGWMFNRTLELLGELHRCHWVHAAVVPPHLLFHSASHGLMLVGWIHAERAGNSIRVVPSAFDDWYEKSPRQHQATTTTDIRLASRTMIWLAGGDPLTCQLPTHFPNGLGRFLQGCAQDRRHEAWAVHAQFRELLEDEFGPPKFCHFTMS